MLLFAIEQKREQMIKFAELYGIMSEEVLKSSQELDHMIDIYQTEQQKQEKSPKKASIAFQSVSTSVPSAPLKKAL